MRTIVGFLLLALCGVLVLGGCANRHASEPGFVFEATRLAPIAIDVQSFNGRVEVEADSGLEQGEVSITREAVHGWKRTGEAEASLEAIQTSVEIVPGDRGQLLRVRTSTTHPEPHFQRAHVRIRAPAVEGVTVHTSRGRVFVKQASGTVDIRTTDGDVRFLTVLPMTDPVSIVTNEGDIDFRIRAESRGRFECESVGGTARFRQRYGDWRLEPNFERHRFNATLNDGDNPILLRVTDGDIRVAIVDDPSSVGARIVDP
jgi:hypothetical protein